MPPVQGQVQAQGPGPAQKAAPVPAVSSLLPAASAPPGAWLPPAFWRPPRPFWLHQPASARQTSCRPRSYPQSLPRPACRQPWWCPFQLCRPSWCPWSAPALPWECCRGRTIRSFFRRRRRSAAGTAPAPTAKIGGFSSYLSFLIKAPYAEALSRPCVGCSVVTWKRASSGSAPQRLLPPGPRCPATAPSDCRPPCWRSRSCPASLRGCSNSGWWTPSS